VRRKTADRLARIETTLEGIAGACEQIADALNPATPGGVAAVAAEAKAARSSSEAAFAGVQALAAVATAKPGAAEIAVHVETTGRLVREVHGILTKTPLTAAKRGKPAA
jgi:hypothetical protein